MKKSLQVITLVVVGLSLGISSAPAQTKKGDAKNANANQSAQAGQAKISKTDAEQRIQQRFPGANIVNTVEATVNGHKAWAVSFSTTGAPAARKAYVDEETGKVSY